MTSDSETARTEDSGNPEVIYEQRQLRFATQASECGQHEGKLVLARGLTFLAGVGALLLGYLDPDTRPIWIALGTLLLLLFLTVAVIDDWLKRRREHLLQLAKVNQWQVARKRREWNAFPVPACSVPDEHASVAKDLDLFGHASLFQLLCLAKTPKGISLLRDWILEPAERDEIYCRQQAVRELTPELELREDLVLRGHMLSKSLAGPDAFVEWAESRPLLERSAWIKWFSRLLPIVGLIAIGLLATNLVSPNVGAASLVCVLLVNVLFSVLYTGKVHDIFDAISTRNGEMRHYLALFELIGEIPAESPRLHKIQQLVVREDGGALRHLKRLKQIMKLASLRHDPVMSIIYFGMQATVLWDFHVLWILERWQHRCRDQVRSWFDALAQLEALFSLSGLAHDQPAWAFPELSDPETSLVCATQLGHPLLTDKQRVSNDVEVGPAGTVLLVTGSNMSGKSTLLRAIGLNAMLAEAGGPVCASAFQLPPLTVTTSMRIQDSLEDGVSFFMAELKRLKAIVDQATEYRARTERTLLYLLDEILQGTNSVERHMAVAQVLAHLVHKGAIGAVSTHDLELAKSPELSQCCRAVHFRETLHSGTTGQQMTFDYLLRDGIATTTNALKLLKMVGLVEE